MLLLALLAVVGIFVVYKTQKDTERKTRNDLLAQISLLKRYGLDFIKGYEAVAKTKSEKALLVRMEADYRGWQNLPEELGEYVAPRKVPVFKPNVFHRSPDPSFVHANSKDVQLDNTSLLLYFGAFLFVAAAGLFVAFGEAAGGIKTFIVLAVTVAMYGTGIWLYRSKNSLRQAAQAFAGIGIVLAPLVGVALYNYSFGQEHGYTVWLLTSFLCTTLYTHALSVFRTTLMGYVLIFTLLSLFESSIGMFDVPVHYYGWGLALVALVLQFANKLRTWGPELDEPTRQGAQIFLPLALLVSLYNAPDAGAVQLGVSLLFATAFYILEFLRTAGEMRQTNAVIAQVSSLVAVGMLAYGFANEGKVALWAMAAGIVIQLVLLVMRSNTANQLWLNYGSVLLISSVIAAALAIADPATLLAMLALIVLVGVSLWLKQWRADGYGMGMLALLAAPYAYGQLVSDSFTAVQQTEAGFVALLMVLMVYIAGYRRSQRIAQWDQTAAAVYIAGVAGVMLASFQASTYVSLIAAAVLSGSLMLIAELGHQPRWAEVAGVVLLLPILRSIGDDRTFLLCAEIGLIILVALTLRYRREALRWLSTIVWLVFPYALAHGGVSGQWPPESYAWGYFVAMLVLIISRAVARGVILLSHNVTISSLTRKASESYAYGYVAAGAMALTASLMADNSRLHTTALLLLLVMTAWLTARLVERRVELLAVVPLLLQALLLSALRPPMESSQMTIYLLFSSVLAVIMYAEAAERIPKEPAAKIVTQSALATAAIAPVAMFFTSLSWAMPIGLAVAGGMYLHYVWRHSQDVRETAVVVMATGFAWFLFWAGVHELQAYMHVAVAVTVFLAYWRSRRGEAATANQYIWVALATTTIPLALQALGAETGGVYGWWLLLEQVIIMLIGMAIGRHFVVLWGLYVSVAAVLYQLRGLGYIALAVLAIFLIAVAIYRLQQDNKVR